MTTVWCRIKADHNIYDSIEPIVLQLSPIYVRVLLKSTIRVIDGYDTAI